MSDIIHHNTQRKNYESIPLFSLLLLFTIATLVKNYSINDISRNYMFYNYGTTILNTPVEKSILFSAGDNATFILSYLQSVEGRRKNIAIYDNNATVFDNIYGSDVFYLSKNFHNKRITDIQTKIALENKNVYYTLGDNLQNVEGVSSVPLVFIYKNEAINSLENRKIIKKLLHFKGYNYDTSNYLVKEIVAECHFFLAEYYYSTGSKELAMIEYKKTNAIGRGISSIEEALSDALLKKNLHNLSLKISKGNSNISSSYAHNRLGNVYLSQKKYDMAIKEYTLATNINPNFADAYNNLGLALMNNRQFLLSVKNYKRAIFLKPYEAKFYNNLGVAYMNLNKTKEAIKLYKKAIKLNSNYSAAYFNLGNAFFAISDFLSAIEWYKNGLKITQDARAYNNLGLAYMKVENYKNAISSFRKALKINPKYLEAKLNMNKIKELRK